ncbi:MAG: glycosyltransferase family 9 protein [Tannerellaceae bacterium]|jgi:ADP-heptose:LPS heptosyltransferase|nr:glycosyltransferase family 9 protein [Tannerellaceae bacterium]
MANILIIRLSAIGDVAMTIPVIYSAARANPDDKFTVLTQVFLIPVFISRPANVEITGINTFGAEKSLGGLLRFARAYATYDFDIVLDLHSVVRTFLIRTLFRLRGKKVFVIDKARKERARLTSRRHKELKPLRSVTDRYADVFRAAGLNYSDTFRFLFGGQYVARLSATEKLTGPKEGKWIGIAPFAKHRGKVYPPERMEQVVAILAGREGIRLFLFGGRGREQEILEEWASRYPHVQSVAGRCSLGDELSLMSHLDLLLCMDSANMHFASLTGINVVSVWGATHPYSGFYGYRQSPGNAIQADMPCRPCSIYGQKPCYRGDHACMTQITPEQIVRKIEKTLAAHENRH